jgi:hypothetical protein
MISHGHRFGEALGFIVQPTRADRIDVAPIVLALRMHLGITIAFRGRSQYEDSLFSLASPRVLCVPSAPTFSVGVGSSR